MKNYIILGMIISCIYNCATTQNDKDMLPSKDITIYQTKADKSLLLQTVEPKNIINNNPNYTITINPTITYQEILGVGASLTHSSAYVLQKNITNLKRKDVLQDLFTKTGIGINYLRLTIGASDFSYSGNFSLNDTPNDIEMKNFNFSIDQEFFLPTLSEITALNKKLNLLGSPWSPPAWMKTNQNMVGGSLKPEMYQAHANYLTAYVEKMKEKGFNIDAITIQNEPLYDKAAYPCMLMTAEEQRDFIKNNLGPTFNKKNIKTKIITYDHNWDHPEYGTTILSDPQAAKYVEGTGFHAYAGTVDAMGKVHNAYPNKNIYFTEQSGGGWAPDYAENLRWNMETLLIDGFRNWTQNVLLWNLALDENFGPTNDGCLDCKGVITVKTNGEIIKNEEYYVLGHIGKFLQKGAKRCESTETKNLKNVSFLNPDGSIVLIISNFTGNSQTTNIQVKNKNYTLTFENQSIYSIILN